MRRPLAAGMEVAMQGQAFPQDPADLLERLAEIEHERWAHWQRYIHGQGQRQEDGSLLLPADLVRRWERQIETPYAALSDAEKESDRDQVRRYLPILQHQLRSS